MRRWKICEVGRAGHKCTSCQLIGYEIEKDNVWIERCCVVLDFWWGWFASLMDLDASLPHAMNLQSIAGRYQLTTDEFHDQCNRNHFQTPKNTKPGYFSSLLSQRDLQSTSVQAYICMCPIWKMLGRCLRMPWFWKKSVFLKIMYFMIVDICNMLGPDGEGPWAPVSPLVRISAKCFIVCNRFLLWTNLSIPTIAQSDGQHVGVVC